MPADSTSGDQRLTDYCVEARGLTKYFDEFKAVDHVDLEVPVGSIYGVLGPNGAGKTTSLRMTLGIIDPDEGTSRLFGSHKPQSVRHRIGYLPEERGLYPGMKAREAIAFMGALRGLDWGEGRRRAATFMAELGLERVIDEKIRKMSKGMAQMVQLIGSIVHAPDLIVLDEPFSGLDPVNQERLETLVRRGDAWHFAIDDAGVEPLLARITASGHGVAGLSIARPGLHDAFVHIVRQVDAGFAADAAEEAAAEASA